MEEEDLIKTNVDAFLTETTLDPSLPIPTVLTFLRKRQTTGQLTFFLNQGGIMRVMLTEKTKAKYAAAKKIRAVLDME